MKTDYCAYPPLIAPDVEITEQRDGDRLAFIIGSVSVGRFLLIRIVEYRVLQILGEGFIPAAICREFMQRYSGTLTLTTLTKFLTRLDETGILAGERGEGHYPLEQQLNTQFYTRFSLFNPDPLFTRLISLLRWVWTTPFFAGTLLLMLTVAALALMNGPEVAQYGGYILREHYIAVIVAGLLVGVTHEFAHGLTCKAFGGRATEVGGLLIYYFLPALYCNVSGLHLIPQRGRRLWVIAAGVYWQLLVGTLALLAWLLLAPFTLFSDLAFIFFCGSMLDVAFNGNPLRLDGYYFLSQWLRMPNLMDRSRVWWRDLLRRIVLGESNETMAQFNRREQTILAVFGLLSFIYTLALRLFIVIFVGSYLTDWFHLPGLLLTAVLALFYIRRPLEGLMATALSSLRSIARHLNRLLYLRMEAKMATQHPATQALPSGDPGEIIAREKITHIAGQKPLRWRRRFIPLAIGLFIILILCLPWNASIGAYGTLVAIPGEEAVIRAPESATLTELRVRPGDPTTKGAILGRMSNAELDGQLAQAEAELARANAEQDRLLGELRVREEPITRAEVQLQQRQMDYDESDYERRQIDARQRAEPNRANAKYLTASVDVTVLPDRQPEMPDATYPAAIAVLQSDADLRHARLSEANLQLDRARRLYAQGVAPRSELDEAETRASTLAIELTAARQRLEATLVEHRHRHNSMTTELRLARSDVEAGRLPAGKLSGELNVTSTLISTLTSHRDSLQRRLAQFSLVTPRTGAVFGEDLPRLVGQFFAKGAEICRVADTRQLMVRIQVPEREIGDARVGHLVRLKVRAYPDQVFRGRVAKIGSESELDQHNQVIYRVELIIENTDNLLDEALSAGFSAGWAASSEPMQVDQHVRQLEPGKPIERVLAAGESHSYQIALDAAQYAKLVVDQRGIDVVVQLFGPDGKQVLEFDSELRNYGKETIECVAEEMGDYRLTVRHKQKKAIAGNYQIRIEELRAATNNDRALQEARKLYEKHSEPLRAGKYDEALTLIERSLEIRERILGPDHIDVASSVNSLAIIYWYKGDYAKAEPLYRRALTAREKALGSEHPDVASSLSNLAVLYRDTGEYGKAEPLYHRALTVREKALGPEHPAIAASLDNLGLFYRDRGEYEKAEPLLQRALSMGEKTLGPEDSRIAGTLNNLAILYVDKGELGKAEPLYQRSLAIKEKTLGPEHRSVVSTLNNLADLYMNKGEYDKIEPYYQRALSINEKALGPGHPGIIYSLNNLASFYVQVKGEYGKAEPLYQRALTIGEKALGLEHPTVGHTLSGLAVLYRDAGDYSKAEPLFYRALAIREKALGPEHTSVADTLNHLAILYRRSGEYGKAEPLYQRALTISEKALGPENPNVAYFLNCLAILYQNKGDYPKAEVLYRRAIAIREKALGPEHPDLAPALNNLGILHLERGEYESAEAFEQRALSIFERAFGPQSYYVAEALNNLARVYAAKADIAQAVSFQARANALKERILTLNLAIGSERQKIAFLALFSKETDFTLSLHSQADPNDPRTLNLAFTTLLHRKGRGLDAMTDTVATLRRHATPQDQALFDQLAEARSQLATLTLKGSATAKLDTYRARLKPLEEKVEQLEAELSTRSDKFRVQTQPVTIASVQAALPAGSALIEFAVYRPLEPQTEKSNPPRYLAYLLAAQGQPKYVDLGDAAVIGRAVDAWRKALRDPNRTDVKKLARAVDEKVMRPLRSLLGEARRLLIAPDGALNLIPFAALVDERNQYLVERYAISYLTSGRDLLRLQTSLPSKNVPLVVANPAFGRVATIATRANLSSGNSQSGTRGRTQSDQSQVFFQSLPSTGHEALAIKSLLPEALLLLREHATESALKQARAPHILHIATHGFFLSDQDPPPAVTLGAFSDDPLRGSDARLNKWTANIENPLLRSGLALTGANQGKSGEDDGLLTALEVAGLDLWGTKLVVLSACDTGLGEVKNGEGVQGLRRALVLAGAESQVMSLWPVLDNTAKDLMIPYYKALRQGKGRSDGMRLVQLQMLRSKKRRHPFYWAAFIQSGEWGNLDGRR